MTTTKDFCGLDVFGLTLHFAATGHGNGFAGGAWRGLLGQALFSSVCPFPAPACATCPALGACAYPKLFKPLPDAALPPFWLHGWQRGRAGWRVGVRWLGRHNAFAVGEWLAALASAEVAFAGAPARLQHASLPATTGDAWRAAAGWLVIPAVLARPTHRRRGPAGCAASRRWSASTSAIRSLAPCTRACNASSSSTATAPCWRARRPRGAAACWRRKRSAYRWRAAC